MPEEAKAEKPKTQKELMAELETALKEKDFKAVTKISSVIAKAEAEKEKSEKEAKQALLAELTVKVKSRFDVIAEELIASGELDLADGIWYSYDFGEKLSTCRLMKGQARARGGGGGGKKFNITTAELLTQHGDKPMGDTGKTFQQVWEETPATDGNARYAIRVKLLKLAGMS
jgi:hypothetical protein